MAKQIIQGSRVEGGVRLPKGAFAADGISSSESIQLLHAVPAATIAGGSILTLQDATALRIGREQLFNDTASTQDILAGKKNNSVGAARAIAATQDGSTVALGYHDGTLHILSSNRGNQSEEIKIGRPVTGISLSSDGNQALVRTNFSRAHLLDISGSKIEEINKITRAQPILDGCLVVGGAQALLIEGSQITLIEVAGPHSEVKLFSAKHPITALSQAKSQDEVFFALYDETEHCFSIRRLGIDSKNTSEEVLSGQGKVSALAYDRFRRHLIIGVEGPELLIAHESGGGIMRVHGREIFEQTGAAPVAVGDLDSDLYGIVTEDGIVRVVRSQ